MGPEIKGNEIDDHVDDEIYECLDLSTPKSFFLFAGAGSGKTKSLVSVLKRIRDEKGQYLRVNRQRIAVITYTNAACDEIKHRLEQDSLFSISTIHSFVWELIRNYQEDIREWLRINIADEIAELQAQQLKGRASKASIDRAKKIESKSKRLEKLDEIRKFSYNPNGDNRTRDSLNHTEVINIAAHFLLNKPLMQDILIKRFPILLIDESQDTKKELIDAFFAVQKSKSKYFSLGLFGDTMQRIYSDGKDNLGKALPGDWKKPAKKMNHRCPKRIVKLINKIRENIDGQEQQPRADKEEGVVRFFIVPNTARDKKTVEEAITKKMADITGDVLWSGHDAKIKTLTLEHHMAARRMKFLELFEPLYAIDRLRTGLIDGTLPGIRLFTQLVLPLVKAKQDGDEFAIARIVRQNSPLFDDANFKERKNQIEIVTHANDCVTSMCSLWSSGTDPKLIQILQNISESGLFSIPDNLAIIAKRSKQEIEAVEQAGVEYPEESDDKDNVIDAWDKALESPFTQIEAYHEYTSDKAKFSTHQGVKGLEFPRVMVILDDEEAKGFLFSYEKLFGAKAPTETDLKNIKEGKETSNDRTLRLFYVSCSRAEKSLAIVEYTSDPASVEKNVLKEGWFEPDEIEIFSGQ